MHRRDKFRAHQATVDAVLASSTEVITQAQVTALNGEHHVESVEITTNDGDVLTRPAQAVVAVSAHSAFRTPEASENLMQAAWEHCRRIAKGK